LRACGSGRAKQSKGSLGDPAFGQDDKSLARSGAVDDFDPHAGQSFLRPAPKLGTLVAAVDIEFQKERIKKVY